MSDLQVPEHITHVVSAETAVLEEGTTSSSSSFVPIDSVQDAIQIIDENKQFNHNILDYITLTSRLLADHRIISVFGSQSTGKSTLLNHLFNTNFDVMDEVNRQQTTKGIWLAISPGVNNLVPSGTNISLNNVLVMDVEGTDGRERGEDQDFERKAALFALSTSEVLIVNLWETQVGLYQGANMGLLKTVFEVNLSLFGKAKLHNNDHKVLLLFVIRDHLGVTPLASLSATITQDLLKIWDNLNKPADVAHLAFSDFFDLAFHTLSHKVLQNDKFLADIRLLGNRFVDPTDEGFLFKPFYHHDIPIEGWTMYAENCWEQIDNNKDLDLPTQQILVAKFKCDEIASQCYDEFLTVFSEYEKSTVDASTTHDYKDVGLTFADMKDTALENYDLSAAKYNKSVYNQKRLALGDRINAKIHDLFTIFANQLLSTSVKAFSSGLSKKSRSGTFVQTVEKLTVSITNEYTESLALLSLDGQLDIQPHIKALQEEVAKWVTKQQVVELNGVISKALKRLNNALSTTILDEISNPTEQTWDRITDSFESLRKNALARYETENGDHDFSLGTDAQVNEIAVRTFTFKSWELFDSLIHKYISKENLLNILKDRFDDKFRYDDNGVPKLYQNAHELEASFGDAKSHAMKAFPILTLAKLSNGTELKPPFDVHNKALKRKYQSVDFGAQIEEQDESEDDSDDDDSDKRFAEIISEKDKADVLSKFKKEIDAKFVETKRSIIQHVTQIPYYIYLVILVLGWNEFMAVLRNPIFFTLLLMVGAGLYVLYLMNLLTPAYAVVQQLVDGAVVVGKEKLREFLIDDHQQHGRNMARMAGNTTSAPGSEATDIELDDLSPAEDSS
ncbi:CIC11C00000002069 [Sungouiella intermedia]|uniref:CIC11C00000002069 n=1 Tax=Sungouiella intermedia TaxID=45354 RepID=A0A1L0DNT5_9ASCO|nr:CIC11C00000002069 [[Candida] intermedia]